MKRDRIILVILALLVIGSIYRFYSQAQTLNRIQDDNIQRLKLLDETIKENENLKSRIKEYSSEEYKEKVFRERLKYYKENDIPVIDVKPESSTTKP